MVVTVWPFGISGFWRGVGGMASVAWRRGAQRRGHSVGGTASALPFQGHWFFTILYNEGGQC